MAHHHAMMGFSLLIVTYVNITKNIIGLLMRSLGKVSKPHLVVSYIWCSYFMVF